MIESLVLIKGKSGHEEELGIDSLDIIHLTNAKQLVIGSAPGFGLILHVAADSPADLGNALLKFAKSPLVAGISTLWSGS